MTVEIEELQQWYASQCDGDWEHEFGVRLATLDNPGWTLTIDLEHTGLVGAPFRPIENLAPERDWIECSVRDGQFRGACGPLMLGVMLRAFLDWARTAPATPSNGAA